MNQEILGSEKRSNDKIDVIHWSMNYKDLEKKELTNRRNPNQTTQYIRVWYYQFTICMDRDLGKPGLMTEFSIFVFRHFQFTISIMI